MVIYMQQEIQQDWKSYAPLLRLENVTKVYGEGTNLEVVALDNVSFDINEGEFVAIMGPSGSGKSTLLNVIGGLTPVTSGKVYFRGSQINTLSDEELARYRSENIGFIFQLFNLFEFLTAEENVMVPLLVRNIPVEEARSRARAILRELGLARYLKHLPSELSGGQQQRIAIARCLVTEPGLILGDEPTGDLDTLSAENVIRMFRKINRERKQTFLIVTHSEWIAKMCDRLIVLEDGKIIKDEKITHETTFLE